MNKFSEPAGEIDIKNIQTSDPKKVEDEAKEPVKEQAKQPDLVHSQKDRKSHTENSIIPIDDPSKLKRSATKQNTGKLSEKDRPKTILHKQLNENSDKRLLDESLGESQYELQRKNSEMKNGKDIAIPGTQPPSPTKEDRKNSEIKNAKNIAVPGTQPPSPTKDDRKNSEMKNGKRILLFQALNRPLLTKEDRKNSEIKNGKNIGVPGTHPPSPTKADRKKL
jgi:type IV secretory pathway VirD2 relaxase